MHSEIGQRCFDVTHALHCRTVCTFANRPYFQQVMNALPWAAMLVVSIILEAAVAVIAALAARAGRPYLYGLAFTFAAYVLYDLARLLQWLVEGPLLSGLFLLATISALVAVWGLYREGRPSVAFCSNRAHAPRNAVFK
jgi:hypothetical protein